MLIPEKLDAIIQILLSNEFGEKARLTVLDVARQAGITAAMARRRLLRLERSGYVSVRGTIRLLRAARLMDAWGYLYSIREIERSEFVSAERPQYVMPKIANWARKEGVLYAFTLFSATELVRPYVAPSTTSLYIHKKDLRRWQQFFREESILPAEKEGNVVCLLAEKGHFQATTETRGARIVSLPRLYADLMSFCRR